MLVTVDDAGRATHVAGDPEYPITAGFLCGKVSNYLDRVYAGDRLLEPLIRDGPKGAGTSARRAGTRRSTWSRGACATAIAAHGGETVLPYFYMGTMGLLQHHSMSARFFHALGRATSSARSAPAPAAPGWR